MRILALVFSLIVSMCLVNVSLAEDNSYDQAQSANTDGSASSSSLTDETASSSAGQTFDGSASTSTIDDGSNLQPRPFSATPND